MGKKEDKYNKRRLKMAYVISVISVTMVLFVLGVFGGLLIGGKKLADYVKQNLKMQVFLNIGTESDKATEIKEFLASHEFVKDVVLITPEEALEEYRSKMEEDPMLMLDENPLPATLEITLLPNYANNESISKLESLVLYEYPDDVAEVFKDFNLIDAVNANINKISLILLGLCGLLSLIMMALINNTIRLQVFSKRFLIKTMQLVGATSGFIRKPFVKSGAMQGLIASTLSSIMILGIVYWITLEQPGLLNNEDFMFLGAMLGGIFVIGLMISYISTRFAVQKFLRLKMDELY